MECTPCGVASITRPGYTPRALKHSVYEATNGVLNGITGLVSQCKLPIGF